MPSKVVDCGRWACTFSRAGQAKNRPAGRFCTPQEAMRKYSMEEVNEILKADLARFERGVATYCPVPLTQGQFDALVSFSFNVGLGTLQRSTMRQKVIRGDMAGAAEELLKYCMAGGKILKGLQKRRIDERAVFLS
jgi:lysozyme